MNLNKQYTTIQIYGNKYFDVIIEYLPRLVSALLILVIGTYVIRFLSRGLKKIMVKQNLDPTLTKFLADIIIWVARVLLFITVISKLGIETTSLVAILGAVGLAVGLSLQGSLSNFAGGLLIVAFKPFKVGDVIEVQGNVATVKEIQIFVTKLITANNHTIFIPNASLSNGIIINYSVQGERRADLTFSISYNADLKKVKDIILKVLEQNTRVLKTPQAEVSVKNITDNAIQIAVRPWAKNDDFGIMVAEVLENCKLAFDEQGIVIQPFVKELKQSL